MDGSARPGSRQEGVGQSGQADFPDYIEADSIVVEIVDKNTGKVFRRSLPVKYFETDNGVILAGETIEGIPCQIALLSETALARMKDVFGKGPDSHRCEK